MKYNLIALTIASLTCIPSQGQFVRKTTAIAAQESYPEFIVGLRNKAEDFLTQQKIRMIVEIDDLRKKGLDYRANELFEQYKETYFRLEKEINLLFDSISRTFLEQAAALDRKNASAKEKVALVARTKEIAHATVTEKLTGYETLIKNNMPNIDKQQAVSVS